jgi:hypothetical protein
MGHSLRAPTQREVVFYIGNTVVCLFVARYLRTMGNVGPSTSSGGGGGGGGYTEMDRDKRRLTQHRLGPTPPARAIGVKSTASSKQNGKKSRRKEKKSGRKEKKKNKQDVFRHALFAALNDGNLYRRFASALAVISDAVATIKPFRIFSIVADIDDVTLFVLAVLMVRSKDPVFADFIAKTVAYFSADRAAQTSLYRLFSLVPGGGGGGGNVTPIAVLLVTPLTDGATDSLIGAFLRSSTTPLPNAIHPLTQHMWARHRWQTVAGSAPRLSLVEAYSRSVQTDDPRQRGPQFIVSFDGLVGLSLASPVAIGSGTFGAVYSLEDTQAALLYEPRLVLKVSNLVYTGDATQEINGARWALACLYEGLTYNVNKRLIAFRSHPALPSVRGTMSRMAWNTAIRQKVQFALLMDNAAVELSAAEKKRSSGGGAFFLAAKAHPESAIQATLWQTACCVFALHAATKHVHNDLAMRNLLLDWFEPDTAAANLHPKNLHFILPTVVDGNAEPSDRAPMPLFDSLPPPPPPPGGNGRGRRVVYSIPVGSRAFPLATVIDWGKMAQIAMLEADWARLGAVFSAAAQTAWLGPPMPPAPSQSAKTGVPAMTDKDMRALRFARERAMLDPRLWYNEAGERTADAFFDFVGKFNALLGKVIEDDAAFSEAGHFSLKSSQVDVFFQGSTVDTDAYLAFWSPQFQDILLPWIKAGAREDVQVKIYQGALMRYLLDNMNPVFVFCMPPACVDYIFILADCVRILEAVIASIPVTDAEDGIDAAAEHITLSARLYEALGECFSRGVLPTLKTIAAYIRERPTQSGKATEAAAAEEEAFAHFNGLEIAIKAQLASFASSSGELDLLQSIGRRLSIKATEMTAKAAAAVVVAAAGESDFVADLSDVYTEARRASIATERSRLGGDDAFALTSATAVPNDTRSLGAPLSGTEPPPPPTTTVFDYSVRCVIERHAGLPSPGKKRPIQRQRSQFYLH